MDTPAERDVGLRVGAVDAELVRALEPFRVAVGRAVQHHHGRAGGDVDTADLRRSAGQAEVGLDRALDAERFLDEVRDALVVLAELVLQRRVLGQVFQRGGEQPGRRLLTGREQERGRAHDRGDVRCRAVGIGRLREGGQHVRARCAPPVFDVFGELLVEPAERVELAARGPARADFAHRALETEALTQTAVVRLGNTEEIGDHEHRERLRV